MAVSIDGNLFGHRLKAVYECFEGKRDELWSGVKSFVIATGPTSEDLKYLKSVAIQQYLMGYEVPDTIMGFLPDKVVVIAGEKKINFLQPLVVPCKEIAGKDLVLIAKGKAEDGTAQCRELTSMLQAVDSRTGALLKEPAEGKMGQVWADTIAGAGLERVEVGAGISDLLAAKSDVEVLCSRKAGYLSAQVMEKFLVKKLEDTVSKGLKVKHSELSRQAEESIQDPVKIQVKLKKELCDIAYYPVVQSGGAYDIKLAAATDDATLHAGVIVFAIGAKYQGYCANLARTYFVDAKPAVEAQYRALVKMQETMAAALTEGAVLAEVYEKGLEYLRANGQEALIPSLPKNLGYATGLELRDNHLVIGPKCLARARAGMTFVIAVGVAPTALEGERNPKRATYAISLADTFLVKPGGAGAEIITGESKRSFGDVAYNLEGGAEEDEAKPAANDGKRLRSDAGIVQNEAVRRKKQEQLAGQVNQSTLERLQAAKTKMEGGAGQAAARTAESMVSYRALGDVPPRPTLTVQVDHDRQTLLLPLYGMLVPFHIATVKTVTASDTADKDQTVIRIIFNVPGSHAGKAYDPAAKFPTCTFIKELSFKSADKKGADKVVQEVKALQRQATAKDREVLQRASLVQQEKLTIAKGRIPSLRDVWVRPTLGGRGRKVPGTLDAHVNGFRYATPRTEEVIDVLYSNIKHAFFQPAEKEVMTMIHFHLHNPIMVNKKKTSDVQFFVEVMEAVQTLDGGRRYGMDPDELEEEQKERERRNRINKEFEAFTKRVQEMWERERITTLEGRDLEWDAPYRPLSFDGVPHKSMCTLLPTDNCLVELTEMPFTVIALDEVEVVNLERAALHLKNFDMAIVNKDFSKDVTRIEAIPIKSLESIKEWLNSVNIKYYESKANLNWKSVIKAILDDPEKFHEEGGWEFLNLEQTDSEDEEGNDGDSDFAPTDDDSGDDEDFEDDEDDSDAESLEEEGSESEYGSEDASGSEAMDWSDLEEEAAKADKEKEYDSDDRKGGKRKGGPLPAKGAPPKKRK